MGGTLERPGRTKGDGWGRRSGGQTGPAHLRGGWEGEGFPRREGPSGARRIGGSAASVSPAQQARRPAGLPGRSPAHWAPGPGPPFSRAPSSLVGPKGWERGREEGGRQGEADGGGGTLQDQRIRGGMAGISPHPLGPQEACWAPSLVLHSPGPPPASWVLGAWEGGKEEKKKRGQWGGAL